MTDARNMSGKGHGKGVYYSGSRETGFFLWHEGAYIGYYEEWRDMRIALDACSSLMQRIAGKKGMWK